VSGVVVRSKEGLRQEIELGPHRLTADEPVAEGGADAGPGPYDLLLASLGACKAITARLYAARKGWPLEGLTVRLEHARIHAADCEACESTEGFIDHIEVEIELAGPLTDEQRERIVEVATRCPVHRTLTSEVEIVTALRG
jgi:putative redox protein